jgi:lysozyme
MSLSNEEEIIVQHLLIEDEGLRQFPYLDCCGKSWRKCSCKDKGKLTIGIGRNLEDVGISESEALELQLNDVNQMTALVERSFPWFSKLNTPRRVVIVSMAFNLGLEGLKGFEKMIKCIASGDYPSASKEMINSTWSSQVNNRAMRLALIMKTGQF